VVVPPAIRGAGAVVATVGPSYREVEGTEGGTTMGTILVGTDTTAAADLAVEDAARMARDRGSELLVLYVHADADGRSVVDPARSPDPAGHLDRLRSRFHDLPIRTRVERGEVADRICAIAEEERADTIVIGNRGAHGTWWRVRDSIPNLVLRHAPCSVLVVDTRRAQ
jgi:nucleotide-binding universal stress UspA family protein